LNHRTAQQNLTLIEENICPKCLGELRKNGVFETLSGELSIFYICYMCESEFTVTTIKTTQKVTA
jgi:hypothetical protein